MGWQNIIGQNNITSSLQREINEGRISHAYIIEAVEGGGGLAFALAFAKEIYKNASASHRENLLTHPDLHFLYPVNTTDRITKDPSSKKFLPQWQQFLQQSLYFNLYDWLKHLNIEKKQGNINVQDAAELTEALLVKSYEGGYKIALIWLPEKMNEAAANKLLKILEEPPAKTVFMLITEDMGKLLPTIVSRCQLIKLQLPTPENITEYLVKNFTLNTEAAQGIATRSANYIEAAKLAKNETGEFETLFIEWVRNAFMAKKNPAVLRQLIAWAENLSKWNREQQRQFLVYASEVFRQALLQNYQAQTLVRNPLSHNNFNWQAFSKYIHGGNIEGIVEEITLAARHIERNANAKIVLLDLAIKLTRLIHQKAEAV